MDVDEMNVTQRHLSVVPVDDVSIQISGMGGVYALTVALNGSVLDNATTGVAYHVHTVVPPNYFSILWQIPQYILITSAEILFSITGLEFAYSQSSPALKSVVQAMWLFTVAIGDIIIILVVENNIFTNLVS
ncbi:CRE-OPT-1 protein [Aphelenchoides avenae]|nr:CRE-OPT-1 protein [Aphelenchus avenae]